MKVYIAGRYDRLKLAWYKWRLRKAYYAWCEAQEDYSCGASVMNHISPTKARMNALFAKCKALEVPHAK